MRKIGNSLLIVITAFALLSGATLAAQQATINDVTVSDRKAYAGASITATVTGTTGVCGAVEINWGDGDTVTYPTSTLPVKQTHVYKTAGAYAVQVRGIANCGGQAGVRLEILPRPEADRTPPPDRTPMPIPPRGTITGIDMPQTARFGDDVTITVKGTGTCRIVVDFDNGEDRRVTESLPYRLTYRFKDIGAHEIVVWTDEPCTGSGEGMINVRRR